MTRPDTTRLEAPDTQCCSQLDAFSILSTCHEHIGERLDALARIGRDLSASGSFGEPQMAGLGDVLAFMDTAIPIHSADEEQTLFPVLRRQPAFAGTDGTPMDCMEAEHEDHGRLLAGLKAAIVKRDATAAADLIQRIVNAYRDHIRKEEEVLYPMARHLLSDAAVIAGMTEDMRARRRQAGLLSC